MPPPPYPLPQVMSTTFTKARLCLKLYLFFALQSKHLPSSEINCKARRPVGTLPRLSSPLTSCTNIRPTGQRVPTFRQCFLKLGSNSTSWFSCPSFWAFASIKRDIKCLCDVTVHLELFSDGNAVLRTVAMLMPLCTHRTVPVPVLLLHNLPFVIQPPL